MIEFILDNLGIVLFVVIAIAARVFQARARARKREETPHQVFTSGLEPDDDDGDEGARYRLEPDEDEGLINYARTRGASAHAVEKARTLMTLMEDQPRFKAFSGKATAPLVPEAPRAAVSASPGKKGQTSAPAPEKQKPLDGFPAKLEKLSPLQRAMVWAEIMGKPKGMA